MCTVNPELEKEVIHDGKNKVLYLKTVKALYGCVRSALMWYQLFSSELTKIGFTINDYDKCVASKMINGKQCTTTWYIVDVKVSHEDSEVVSSIIKILESKFGALKTTRGKKHTYLGMKIELMANNEISIDMRDYIEEIIEMMPTKINTISTSPANNHLFTVMEGAIKLEKDEVGLFHSVVAKLSWVMKRGRSDLEVTISFLFTRVKQSTKADWEN